MMALKLKIPPASEPLTLSEAKAYLRISDTDDDALISALISAVRQKFEDWARRSLITQTWTLWLDGLPNDAHSPQRLEGVFDFPVHLYERFCRTIEIPRGPLQAVTFFKTYDTADTAAVFDSSNYQVDAASVPGRIALKQTAAWPSGLREVNAVEIEFVAGYGNAADVPEPVKQGMLVWIKLLFAGKSKLFESDEATPGLLEFNRESIPVAVKALWQPYRIDKL